MQKRQLIVFDRVRRRQLFVVLCHNHGESIIYVMVQQNDRLGHRSKLYLRCGAL